MTDEALVSSSWLSHMLAARRLRSIHADPKSQPGRLICAPSCEWVDQGPADLALVSAPNPQAAQPLVDSARSFAPAVAVRYTDHASASRARKHPAVGLEMGPDGGIWTPHFCIDLAAPPSALQGQAPPSSTEGAALMIVGSQRLAVEAVLAAALARGVEVGAAIALGHARGGATWKPLLNAAESLQPAPVVALLLTQPADPRQLVRAATESSLPVILLPLGPTPGGATAPPHLAAPLSIEALSTAMGWTPAPSPELAAEVAWLRCRGVSPRTGRIAIAGPADEIQCLTRQVIEHAGLPAPAVEPIAPTEQSSVHADVLLGIGPAPRQDHAPPRLRIDVGSAPPCDLASHATLAALAALLRTTPRASAPAIQPAPATTRAARQALELLDHLPVALDEDQCKQVLRLFGLPTPRETSVTSATAAARAAASIGLPVVVKAIGPGLRERASWGGIVHPVTSVAGVRQAFRDVVAATQTHHPEGLARSVAIAALTPLTVTLDIALFRLGTTPLMQIQARRDRTPLGEPMLVRCPLTSEAASHLARALLRAASPTLQQPPRPNAELRIARFHQRLSAAAAALASRIEHMRLDTVTLGEDGTPPLILDAHAEKRRK